MHDQEQRREPRKALIETDARGRIHVAVEKMRFYASVLGSVAVATGVVMAVSSYLLSPYLASVARSAMAPEVQRLDQRIGRYVTKEAFQEHEARAESRANTIAGQINQASRILETVERRLEIHSRRIDRLYEHQWESRPSAAHSIATLAPWPPPEDLRPPGWEMWGTPR